ncbi:MBOAT family protein [Flavobacterium sp.]|uniref:MBOAT family O-acyltransferase n=1 Tax=Flavobacterium sp. TaxID=239 RepID=UPI0012114C28|nr:MBOAT family protein [Flavobacterium sp.]RZJ70924.1 MAG: MBOAT family protein [Flavobacterium sp.]
MMSLMEIQQWFLDNWESWFLFNKKEPILFNTPLFLGMFLIFYPIYTLTLKSKTHALRNLYVFAFSLFFYYKSSGVYFCLLLISGVTDYNLAKLLYQETQQAYRKFYLVLSVVLNLAFLGYFKYTNFLIDNYNGIFSGNIAFHDIILPVGISFYTFQSMSYIIDIYRKELQPTKNILDYMFFVSFFPQLVAGPIVRASEFLPQIYKKITLSREEVNYALFLIIGGLLKKTVISDYISINFVDRVFDQPNLYTPFENLMASYGYTIQIYCDFSGYSDMAIGIAMLMGFRLSTNFRTPYKSASVTEFWRRWHISLSTWLRDYLYISLGGNRKGKFRTYLNLFLTMLLGGLWHGASWKFVIWGCLHGLALVVERLFKGRLNLPKNFFVHAIQVVLTFHFVVFCWIFFRAKDFATAFEVIKNIGLVRFNPNDWLTILSGYRNVFIVMAIGYLWHFLPSRWIDFLKSAFDKMPIIGKAFVLALTYWVVYATATSGPQPFIYFQF